MSEIKEILNKKEEEQKNPIDTTVSNVEDITNIKSKLESTQQEIETVKKQNRDLEFSNKFSEIAPIYPHAKDFKDKIKEKVDAGYSVEDATYAVLGKEGKLITAQQMQQDENKNQGFGGSATTVTPSEKKEKTLEELRQEVIELEARGEIRLS